MKRTISLLLGMMAGMGFGLMAIGCQSPQDERIEHVYPEGYRGQTMPPASQPVVIEVIQAGKLTLAQSRVIKELAKPRSEMRPDLTEWIQAQLTGPDNLPE